MATPPPLAPKGMTRTVGYFNNNNSPIRLDCSALGVNFTLEKKGQYILQMVDGVPTKVNDPYFDAYLRGTGLSKEETADGSFIPIRFLPRQTQAPTAQNRQGFSGQHDTNSAPASLPPAAAGDTSITGMTMEQAKKSGIFGRQREVVIPDDFGVAAPGPGQAQPASLPSLSDVGRPQRPAAPQGGPQRPSAPAPLPLDNNALAAALDINGPPPSLEENESLPTEVLGTHAVPLAPAPIMAINPGTGQPLTATPVVSPQQAAKAIQFEESLPAPNLDTPEEVTKNKGEGPEKFRFLSRS